MLGAVLKRVLSWNMFQTGIVCHSAKKMCHSETCFRLELCKHCHIESRRLSVSFLTYSIWSSPTFITEKQTNKQTKCSSLVLLSVSLHKFLCLRIWNLICGFDKTKFAQCPSQACFKMAYFQNGTQCQSETCFRMAHVSERHATSAYWISKLIRKLILNTTQFSLWQITIYSSYLKNSLPFLSFFFFFFMPWRSTV